MQRVVDVKMKRLMFLFLMIMSVISLGGCQEETVNEQDLKSFITEYKKIIYTADAQNSEKNTTLLKEVEPYMSKEIFEKNKINGVFDFPQRFAKENQKNIKLHDVIIDSIQEAPEDNSYKINYTLLVMIGDEQIEKAGEMTIQAEDGHKFLIIYDWESPVTVDNKKFL